MQIVGFMLKVKIKKNNITCSKTTILKKSKPESKILGRIKTVANKKHFDAALDYSSRKKFLAFNHICPEQALWRGVLLQMLEDALTLSKKPEAKGIKARAIAWFFGNDDGYLEVCDLAEVDHIRFKKFVLEKLRAKNNYIML